MDTAQSDCSDAEGPDVTLTTPADENLSSFRSRGPLLTFAEKLFLNKFDRCLASMAKECVAVLTLDLTKLNSIVAALQTIDKLYEADFPAVPVPAEPLLQTVSVEAERSIEVRLTTPKIATRAEYDEKLKSWSEAVQRHDNEHITQFVKSRCEIVQDNREDVDKLKKKLARIPVVTERKRKLFIYDGTNELPLDWPKMKRQRKSMYNPPPSRAQ